MRHLARSHTRNHTRNHKKNKMRRKKHPKRTQIIYKILPINDLKYTSPKEPMKICLVGPGILPIPPPGWGATEILIWEYYQELKRNHDVTIVNPIRRTPEDSQPNTEYTRKLIQTINDARYDFVHLHYDCLYHILTHLKAPHKAITSHYPFLNQIERHASDGFTPIFRFLCEQSQAYLFVLSNQDEAVFLKHGVPPSRIVLCLNGSNPSTIQQNPRGLYESKSIYIGKVEPRKRQHLFDTIPNLDFYGPGANTSNPSYKGEMNHADLMKLLPHYGNLVLLSSGEGTPLVVKEALMAGLPIVISECCAADLDAKPYIDIVPEERIHDKEYVSNLLEASRQKKQRFTHEIRTYAESRFSWQALMKTYVGNIERILSKN